MQLAVSSPRPFHQARARASSRLWVLAVLALLAGGANMPSPLYSHYQRAFGFDDLTMTAVYATYGLVSVPALLLLGPLGDRLAPRMVLRAGVLLGAFGTSSMALASSTGWLFTGRVAYGLALGLTTGVGMATVSRAHGERVGSVASGALAFVLGSALGPALTGVVAQFAPAPSVTPYAVHLVLLAVTFAGLRSAPTKPAAATGRHGGSVHSRPAQTSRAERRRRLALAAANGFLGWAVVGLFLGLLPSSIEQGSAENGVALAGAVAGAVLLCSALAPPLVSRLGCQRAQSAGLLLVVPSLLLVLSGPDDVPSMLAAGVIGGFAHGLLYGGAAEDGALLASPGRASTTTAVLYVAFYLGAGLPALAAGLLSLVMPLPGATATMTLVALTLTLTLLPISASFARSRGGSPFGAPRLVRRLRRRERAGGRPRGGPVRNPRPRRTPRRGERQPRRLAARHLTGR